MTSKKDVERARSRFNTGKIPTIPGPAVRSLGEMMGGHVASYEKNFRKSEATVAKVRRPRL